MKLKETLLIVVLVVLSGQAPTPVFSAISNANHSTYQTAIKVKRKEKPSFRHRALKFANNAKQSLKERLRNFLVMMWGEKASKLAKNALYLFLGSIVLIVLAFVIGFLSAPLLFVLSSAFLASSVLALIVLLGDQNKKSKTIAMAILITWGLLVLLTILLIRSLLQDDTS